jgi:hypothetical protein
MADMVADPNLGSECFAGGIRMLGMVAKIYSWMAQIRFGVGIFGCLPFSDGLCLPLPMIRRVGHINPSIWVSLSLRHR